MTLHDYLLDNLSSTVMISLSVDETGSYQYNYWNWFHQIGQLHLLRDDYSIGHIIHSGSVFSSDDGGITNECKFFPKRCKMNFYFGGATP